MLGFGGRKRADYSLHALNCNVASLRLDDRMCRFCRIIHVEADVLRLTKAFRYALAAHPAPR